MPKRNLNCVSCSKFCARERKRKNEKGRYCFECYKKEAEERQKAYQQTPILKQRRKEYYQRPEVKERRKEYMRTYRQRPEIKERKKEYMRTYFKKRRMLLTFK